MTVGTPAWLAASGGSPSYDATELRVIDTMYATYDGNPLGGRDGRRPGGTGLNVSLSGSPTNWNVAPGVACVSGITSGVLGVYVVPVTATESGALDAADATFPRKDILVLQVSDTEAGDALAFASVNYIPGTPSATPSSPAVPARSLLLATIDVPKTGSGSPAVTQNLKYTVASGGVLPTATRPASPYAGMTIFNTTSGIMEYWGGSSWIPLSGAAPSVVVRTVAGDAVWTKPANAKWVEVECWGGGGAGGGAGASGGNSGNWAEGAGGGSGGYVRKLYDAADLNATEAYTVGAGGTGGGATGGTGGDTTFKGLTAGGGTGGQAMSAAGASGGNSAATSATTAAGVGGNATGGDLNSKGGQGGRGRRIGQEALLTGFGAAAPCGGGTTSTPNAAGTGVAGAIPGGGGSGAFGTGTSGVFSGGNGAVGKIIIRTYF
jgi:hypothetical protein